MSRLHVACFASLALFGACAGDPIDRHDPSPSTVTTVAQTVAIEGYDGTVHEGWLELEVASRDYATGRLTLLGESFGLAYSTAEEDLFVITNERSGAVLSGRQFGGDAEVVIDAGRGPEVFRSADELATLTLETLDEHTQLLLAAQVMEDVGHHIEAGVDAYFPWLAVAIIAAVVIESCTGTDLSCTGSKQVWCPNAEGGGHWITDPCGCGETACSKCWPNRTCSDECSVVDLCPEISPPGGGVVTPK